MAVGTEMQNGRMTRCTSSKDSGMLKHAAPRHSLHFFRSSVPTLDVGLRAVESQHAMTCTVHSMHMLVLSSTCTHRFRLAAHSKPWLAMRLWA